MPTHKNALEGFGKQVCPSAMHVRIYLSQKGLEETTIEHILTTILTRGWKTQTGKPIKNWKQYLFQWQYILKDPRNQHRRKFNPTKKQDHAKRNN